MKRFTKKALPLAIAAAMAPGFANAADVSGFADIKYSITDDSANPTDDPATTSIDESQGTNGKEGKFGAYGEINVSASPTDGVTVRVDVDLDLAANGGSSLGGDSARIEQAFFAWGAAEGLTVIGGVFNNPIGYDAEDSPDMDFASHDVIYNILDHQTALDGDNVAGLAAAYAAGPVTITAALLNETAQTNDEMSMALVLNASPVEGLNLEFGYVSQADDATRAANAPSGSTPTASAGDVIDINATYAFADATIGFDFLVADKHIDSAYAIWATYAIGSVGLGLRAEGVSYEVDSDDSTRTTLYAKYKVASNLKAAIEISDGDHGTNPSAVSSLSGINQDSTVGLKLTATF